MINIGPSNEAWYERKIPPRLHMCRPASWGFIVESARTGRGGYIERCACGALRSGVASKWMERNSRRKELKKGGPHQPH